MEQSEFIQHYGPLAQDIADKTGLDQSVVLGQMAQESSWGNHFVGNNPYGISNPNGSVVAYPDIPTASQAYVDLINKRYGAAAKETDPDKQALSLQVLGYNNHAGYGATVGGLAKQIRGMQAQGAGAPSADQLEQAVQTHFGGAAAPAPTGVPIGTTEPAGPTEPEPSPTAPTAKQLGDQVEKDFPSSKYGPGAENFGIPTGGKVATNPPQMMEDLPPVGEVMANAYQNGPQILTPETQAALAKSHPWIAGVVDEGNALLGGMNSLWQGGLYGLAKVGDAIVPPNAGGGFGRSLAGVAEAEVGRRMAERVPSPDMVTQSGMRSVPSAEDLAARNQTPTPPPVAEYSKLKPAEKIDALDARNGASASDRQVGGMDKTPYVPDTNPPLAQREPTPPNVAKYDVVDKNSPAMSAAQEADNAARLDYASSIDTSASTEAALRGERRAEADFDLQDAFRYKSPVDAQPIVDKIDELMDSGLNKRPAIAGPLMEVRNRLYKTAADGTKTLESDPETLYNVRQSINDMLDRSNPNNAGNLQAKAQLTDLGNRLDKIIEPGTSDNTLYRYANPDLDPDGPNAEPEVITPEEAEKAQAESAGSYSRYKDNYRFNSQPINEIEALRDAGFDDLKNSQGTMTLGKVQKVLDNLIDGVKRGGTNNALSVSDGTWHTLFNLRDDLARKESLVNPTSGNIRPAMQPPASEKNALLDQLKPSLGKRIALGAGTAAADLVLNHLISGGALGSVSGTVAGMALNNRVNKIGNSMAGRAGAAQINAWTNQLLGEQPGYTPLPTSAIRNGANRLGASLMLAPEGYIPRAANSQGTNNQGQ